MSQFNVQTLPVYQCPLLHIFKGFGWPTESVGDAAVTVRILLCATRVSAGNKEECDNGAVSKLAYATLRSGEASIASKMHFVDSLHLVISALEALEVTSWPVQEAWRSKPAHSAMPKA